MFHLTSRARRAVVGLAALVLAAAATGLGFAQTYATQSASGTLLGPYAEVYVAGATGAPAGKYNTVWNATVTAHQNVPGTFSTGDLFVVSNPNNYDGTLEVSVYLDNTGALTSAFKYFNLEVGLWYATGSGTTLTWTNLGDHVLSLSQGAATFDVPAADFYNGGTGNGLLSVSVDGGDYESSTTGAFTVTTSIQVHPETGNA